MLVVDEATFKVRDSIPLSIGVGYAQLSLNHKHLYASEMRSEHIEIIDIETKKSLQVISLSSDTLHVKISLVGMDPHEHFAVLSATTWAKKRDHYEIHNKPLLLRYDIDRHVVTDTLEEGKGLRLYSRGFFSPNGDLLYVMSGDEVVIYDTQTLKPVDRWNLGKAFYQGGLRRLPLYPRF